MSDELGADRQPWASFDRRQRQRQTWNARLRRDGVIPVIFTAAGLSVIAGFLLLDRPIPGWAWAWVALGALTVLLLRWQQRVVRRLDDAEFDRFAAHMTRLSKWVPWWRD